MIKQNRCDWGWSIFVVLCQFEESISVHTGPEKENTEADKY